ncbi:hypothetical protein GH714_029904 [Hevea brasiliensis]|uniref:indole-3-glycerol-phosphate synthase n=1 Tax=Hevea brasiliensis TaxID=3981 RepID=A0A6A6K8B9_HEVBR|nr:hypothetical protein GH714_029904 [Hevea brasiliensis]
MGGDLRGQAKDPFESKLAHPNAKVRAGELLHMQDLKDWTVDVSTDAFTSVEESVMQFMTTCASKAYAPAVSSGKVSECLLDLGISFILPPLLQNTPDAAPELLLRNPGWRMEGLVSPKVSLRTTFYHGPNFSIRRPMNLSKLNRFSVASIRAQQPETKDGAAMVSAVREEANALQMKEWEVDMLQNEVASIKERRPLHALKKSLENAPPSRDFTGALKEANLRTGLPGLIAEVKKASPSRGILREDFDPVEIAQSYERGGAACLSVLTDEKYFKGSFENLEAIRQAGVKCPLLCKEFVIDAWQIYYARIKGADAILLIAAVLPDLDIRYMVKICKMLGLAVLVEVHDEREMDRVLGIEGIELIGINNRNLETFEVDISNTRKLLEGERGQLIRQKDIIVVGESGLFTPDDIAYVQEAGVKAVLVGESIVKQSDPGKGITGLFGKEISLS